MNLRRPSVLALAPVVVLLALGASRLSPPAHSPPVPPSARPSALPGAQARASASASPDGARPDDECSDEASERHLSDAEVAQEAKDLAGVRRELEAAVRSRPMAGRPRALLARRLREDGKLKEAAAEAWLALALEQENVDLWTILGLASEERGGRDEARAYFARARAMGDGEGKAKLGSRSTCTGARFLPVGDPWLTIVKGWTGVHAFLQDSPLWQQEHPGLPAKTEAAARAHVCVSGAEGEAKADSCEGPGPWGIRVAEQNFHTVALHVAPLPQGRFALVWSSDGNTCTGGSTARIEVHDEVIEVIGTRVRVVSPTRLEGGCPVMESTSGVCATMTEQTRAFFDARSGRARLEIVDTSEQATYALRGSTLVIEGPEGCRDTIDLRRLPAGLGPAPGE